MLHVDFALIALYSLLPQLMETQLLAAKQKVSGKGPGSYACVIYNKGGAVIGVSLSTGNSKHGSL